MNKPSVLVMGEALVDVVTRGSEVDEHVGGSPARLRAFSRNAPYVRFGWGMRRL
jgi:hypothetical protein